MKALTHPDDLYFLDALCEVRSCSREEALACVRRPMPNWAGVSLPIDTRFREGRFVSLSMNNIVPAKHGAVELPFERLEALEALACEGNHLATISLQKNKFLRVLHAKKNAFELVDLRGCAALTASSLGAETLLQVLFDEHPVLSTVELEGAFSSLDLRGCRRLESLRWSSPQLTSLSIAGLKHLRSVCCNSAGFTEFSLDELPMLDRLELHFCNALLSVSLGFLPSLTELSLQYDPLLQRIDVSACPQLEKLSLTEVKRLREFRCTSAQQKSVEALRKKKNVQLVAASANTERPALTLEGVLEETQQALTWRDYCSAWSNMILLLSPMPIDETLERAVEQCLRVTSGTQERDGFREEQTWQAYYNTAHKTPDVPWQWLSSSVHDPRGKLVRSLSFRGAKLSMEQAFAALAEKDLSRIRSLSFSETNISEKAATRFRPLRWTDLQQLSCWDAKIPSAAAQQLLQSEGLRTLRSLTLSGATMDVLAKVVTAPVFSSLETLYFLGVFAPPGEFSRLLETCNLPSLRAFKLFSARFSLEELRAFSASTFSSLTTLELRSCELTNEALEVLLSSDALLALETLDLSGNFSLTERSCDVLFRWAERSALRSLELSHTKIGTEGIARLLQSERFETVELGLQGCV